jgi:hypothetical protein
MRSNPFLQAVEIKRLTEAAIATRHRFHRYCSTLRLIPVSRQWVVPLNQGFVAMMRGDFGLSATPRVQMTGWGVNEGPLVLKSRTNHPNYSHAQRHI